MEQILIKLITMYSIISIFILLNLMFNPNLDFHLVNKETGKRIEPPLWFYIVFSFGWIFSLYILCKRERDDRNE